MPQPNLSDTTDVVPAQDFTIAIPHPDRDDLGRRLAASRCPSESGADYGMPLADVPALTENGVWP
jgi:hypothetical protein